MILEGEKDLRNNLYYDKYMDLLREGGNLDFLGPDYDNLEEKQGKEKLEHRKKAKAI